MVLPQAAAAAAVDMARSMAIPTASFFQGSFWARFVGNFITWARIDLIEDPVRALCDFPEGFRMVLLILHVLHRCRSNNKRAQGRSPATPLANCFATLFTVYGGGVICDLVVGRPVGILSSAVQINIVVFCWILVNFVPGAASVMTWPPIRGLLRTGSTIRSVENVMFGALLGAATFNDSVYGIFFVALMRGTFMDT